MGGGCRGRGINSATYVCSTLVLLSNKGCIVVLYLLTLLSYSSRTQMDKKHYLLGLFKDNKITNKVSTLLNTQRPRLKIKKKPGQITSWDRQQGRKTTRMAGHWGSESRQPSLFKCSVKPKSWEQRITCASALLGVYSSGPSRLEVGKNGNSRHCQPISYLHLLKSPLGVVWPETEITYFHSSLA